MESGKLNKTSVKDKSFQFAVSKNQKQSIYNDCIELEKILTTIVKTTSENV